VLLVFVLGLALGAAEVRSLGVDLAGGFGAAAAPPALVFAGVGTLGGVLFASG
jgi:hypothetical protein